MSSDFDKVRKDVSRRLGIISTATLPITISSVQRRDKAIRDLLTYPEPKAFLATRRSSVVSARAEYQRLLPIARSTNFFEPTADKIFNTHVPKVRGGFREISVIPLSIQLAHYVVAHIAVSSHQISASQYCWRGRGGYHRCIRDLRDYLAGNPEIGFVTLCDIQQAFSSTNFNAVRNLDLIPEEVFESRFNPENLNFHTWHSERSQTNITTTNNNQHYTHDEGLSALYNTSTKVRDWPGLLEGAASSAALFAILIDDTHKTWDHMLGQLFGYSDNFIIACRGQSNAEEAGRYLASQLATHPAGPYHLRWDVVDIREGFEQLGYYLQREGVNIGVNPSYAATERMCGRLLKLERNDRNFERQIIIEASRFPAMGLTDRQALLDALRYGTTFPEELL